MWKLSHFFRFSVFWTMHSSDTHSSGLFGTQFSPLNNTCCLLSSVFSTIVVITAKKSLIFSHGSWLTLTEPSFVAGIIPRGNHKTGAADLSWSQVPTGILKTWTSWIKLYTVLCCTPSTPAPCSPLYCFNAGLQVRTCEWGFCKTHRLSPAVPATVVLRDAVFVLAPNVHSWENQRHQYGEAAHQGKNHDALLLRLQEREEENIDFCCVFSSP